MNIFTLAPTVRKELQLADELHLSEVNRDVSCSIALPSGACSTEPDEEVNVLEPSVLPETEKVDQNTIVMVDSEDTVDSNETEVLEGCDVEALANIECQVNICSICNNNKLYSY